VLAGTVIGTRLLRKMRSRFIHKLLLIVLVIVAVQVIRGGIAGLLGGAHHD